MLLGASVLLGVWVVAVRRSRKNSELQLRRIMDNSPEALVILDVTKSRFAVVNERAVRLYGLPAEQLLTMGVADVSPPFQPDGRPSSVAAAAMIQEAIDGGEPVFPWVHCNAAGQCVPCEVRLVLIPEKKRVLVRGSVVDISERLQSEDALRRSEERFRAVVDAQRELLYRWLPDGTRTFVNRAYCLFFERPEVELVGVSFLTELEEEDRARILDRIGTLSSDNPVAVSEVHVRGKDGGHWLEWSDTGLFDNQGELVEIQSIGRDVTERRNAQENLEYTRSLLAAALEQSPAGIAIAAAPDGHIRLANQAMMELLGATRENLEETLDQLRRNGFYRADGTSIRERDLPMHKALFKGETTRDVEMRVRSLDGRERWVSISSAPVKNASGQIVAGILVSADVAETKRVQLAIRGIVESVSAVSGKEYYEALVRQLSRVLDSDIAFVGELIERRNRIQPLALCIDGELTTVPAFDWEGTPSSEVILRGRSLVCGSVQKRFPDDPHLQSRNIKSYIGVPLLARNKEPVGVLGIYGRGGLDKVRFKVDILKLFGTQASTELEGERTARVLMQSEERFRSAFEEAPIGTIILDREGLLRQANKTMSRLIGYSRRELVTMWMRDLVHPDELERMFQAKHKMLSGEIDTDSGEQRMLHKDGTPLWVDFSARVMRGPSGEKFVLMMIADISARRRAEQNLEASRKLQRIVAEASAGFFGCRSEEVDRRIEEVLTRVGDFLSVDRIVLYEVTGNRGVATHFWLRNEEAPALPLIRRADFPNINGWGTETFKFGSFEELPSEAMAERRVFSDLGVKSFIGIPLHVNGSLAGVFSLSAVRSERAWPEELEEWLRILGEMLASVITRRRVEMELRDNMELQRLIAEISASFVGTPAAQLDTQIQEALKRVGEFLQIDRITLYRLDEVLAERLHFWNRDGYAEPFVQLSLLTEVPFLCRAARAGEVVSFSRIDEVGKDMAVERDLFSRLATRSFLALPLPLGSSQVGSLVLATVEQERQWPSSLVQWMRVFGEMLASAIARKAAEESQNASRRQLRGLAHELTRVEDEERRRCAIYLHDQISQTLAVMRMRFGELLLPGSEEERRACIDQIRGLLEKTIDDTQTLTFDLSPPVLHDLGLVAAIEWISEKICSENEIELQLEIAQAVNTIPKDAKSSSILFRSVRELLTNVVRHGAASIIQIKLEFTNDGISIIVIDNGVGFDASILESGEGMKRFGLFSIRERLDFIGGSLDVSSRLGHGTQVSLFVPSEASPAESQLALP